jgi:hypothetical protein
LREILKNFISDLRRFCGKLDNFTGSIGRIIAVLWDNVGRFSFEFVHVQGIFEQYNHLV